MMTLSFRDILLLVTILLSSSALFLVASNNNPVQQDKTSVNNSNQNLFLEKLEKVRAHNQVLARELQRLEQKLGEVSVVSATTTRVRESLNVSDNVESHGYQSPTVAPEEIPDPYFTATGATESFTNYADHISSQGIDPVWSLEAQTSINTVLSSEAFSKFDVMSLGCYSTACQVRVGGADISPGSGLVSELRKRLNWNSQVLMQREQLSEGGAVLNIYISRDGESLPAVFLFQYSRRGQVLL